MITHRDIVVVGIQAWDIAIGSNCKNIAEEFAKNNRVLYVNLPISRSAKHKDPNSKEAQKRIPIVKSGKQQIEFISKNLWTLYPATMVESINWIPVPFIHDYLNWINSRRFSLEIKKAVNQLGFKNFILFNDSLMTMGVNFTKMLKPDFYIYYIRDNLIMNPYWGKHGKRLEPILIKQANLVTTNSTLYAEYAAAYNKHSYMVGQGCDTSMYVDNESISIPDDLKSIGGIVIGYIGFLSHRRLDIHLLSQIARKRPDWNIVLVGPEDDEFRHSDLHGIPNVYFLGSKPQDLVPAYIRGFDVAINPQVMTPITMGNYPRKVDEYLAMGKPVVCSATKAMEYFGDAVYLASSADEYILKIDLALKENNGAVKRYRESVGHSHSWENNVAEIYKYIHLVENE